MRSRGFGAENVGIASEEVVGSFSDGELPRVARHVVGFGDSFVAFFGEAFFAGLGDFLTGESFLTGEAFLTTFVATRSASASAFSSDCTAFLGERRSVVTTAWTTFDFLPFLGVPSFAFAMMERNNLMKTSCVLLSRKEDCEFAHSQM